MYRCRLHSSQMNFNDHLLIDVEHRMNRSIHIVFFFSKNKLTNFYVKGTFSFHKQHSPMTFIDVQKQKRERTFFHTIKKEKTIIKYRCISQERISEFIIKI